MSEPDELLGRTLGERWVLRRRLGAGGMGAVYLADDLRGGVAAAVKVVKRELLDDAEARARFSREADALRRLDHPCIVRFLDTGEGGELRYIAMELLEGQTLKGRLGARGAMPWRETLPILRDVVRALDAAHAAGLIHRDLKPENVFLLDSLEGPREHPVKLLDFGVARHVQMPAGQTMTATGVVLGTPGFVAPEVVLKGPSNDPRSDFYGLGATWFEMLTGEKPFSAETPFALAMLHVSMEAPRPSSVRPGLALPVRGEALLLSLLAKTPEARPPSAAVILEELAALEQCADGPAGAPEIHSSLHNRFLPIESTDTPLTRSGAKAPADLLPHEATLGFTRPTATPVPRRDRRRIAVAASLTVALVIGAGLVLGLRSLGSPSNDDALPPAPTQPPDRQELLAPPSTAATPPPVPAPAPPSEEAAEAPTPSAPVAEPPKSAPETQRAPKPRTPRGHKPELLPLEPPARTQ